MKFFEKFSARAVFVLFVPGLYGSTLIDKNSHELKWANASQVLFQQVSWALPVPGLRQTGKEDLVSKEVLKNVPIIGSLYGVDAYGNSLSNIEKICRERNCTVVPVPYDWRKDPLEGVGKIQSAIETHRKSPKDEFIIVAHSYGAVITSYFLRYGSQNYHTAEENWSGLKQIKGAVMVAAPYYGGNALFRNAIQGTKWGSRITAIPQSDYATFEAAYFLSPPPSDVNIVGQDLKPLGLKLDDVTTWEENGWGLFSKINREHIVDVSLVRNYLKDILARASKFYEKQLSPIKNKPENPARIIFVGTQGTPTIERGVLKPEKIDIGTIVAFNPPDIKTHFPKMDSDWSKIDGDGSISVTSQRLPPALDAIAAEKISLAEGHLEALESEEVKKKVTNLLMNK